MYKFEVSIDNLSSIKIYTDMEKVRNKLIEGRGLKKTIPATIKFEGNVNEVVERKNYITLLNSSMQNLRIDKESNITNIFIDESEFFFPDLVYLAIGMLANILQRKGYYFVQCSVVKYDNTSSLMLVGDPNAGKTSLAYSLIKEKKYKLISNDNALVYTDNGLLKTYCGSKYMQMRVGAIKNYFPEMYNELEFDKVKVEKDEWNIKEYINEYYENNGYEYDDKSIVTDIYNIDAFIEGNTFIKQREKLDQVLYVYENLTKQIRNNRYALVSLNEPLPSFEDEAYMKQRYDMSRDIVESTNVYDAKGTIRKLTRIIGEKYEK